MNALALHAPLAPASWWQLWSCHVVHWDAAHLLRNALAAAPALLLVDRRIARQWLRSLPLLLPLMSVALLEAGFIGEYRGASGLVVSLWAFGGIALLRQRPARGALMAIPLLAKLVAEAAGSWPAPPEVYVTIPAIHYAGAAAGALAAALTLTTPFTPPAGRKQPS